VHLYGLTSVLFFIVGGVVTFCASAAWRQPGWRVRHLISHFFPLAQWRTPTIRVDVMFYLSTKFTQIYKVLISTFISAAATLAIRDGVTLLLHVHAEQSYGISALLVAAIAIFIFGDLGAFVCHVLEHRFQLLWEFHKIHHSSTFLTPMTSFRSHPVSDLLNGVFMGLFEAIPLGLCAAIWHFSLDDRLLLSSAPNLALGIGPLAVLQHTHFPISFGRFEWLFISPLMHQAHHSRNPAHFNKNFGSRLSIWDWCIGTAMILPKDEPFEFGLNAADDERGDYSSVLWCYAGPFINCARILAGARRAP